MFSVERIDSRVAEGLEPLGTKRKFWFTHDGRQRLFKAEDRGTGEDWAEKIASELCALLGLPHVVYELALDSNGQTPGVLCDSFAPPPLSLVLGNQLLMEFDPSYPKKEGSKFKVREHTVDAVASVLQSLDPPTPEWSEGLPKGIDSALDVFVGYAMLDAWIANQDRHHENWGALRHDDTLYLAPTFDHGASLARNLSDRERKERLETRDSARQIPAFTRRARSLFYAYPSGGKALSTVEAWRRFSEKSPGAGAIWLDRLGRIDHNAVSDLLKQVPTHRLSKIGRDFTHRLLMENRQRILDGDER